MKNVKKLLILSMVIASGMIVAFANAPDLSGVKNDLPAATPTPEPAESQFKSYRGVSIGMTADQARAKLGTPKEKSAAGDYYVFSETESAQLIFEKDQTIRSITVNFTGDLKAALSPKDVFGTDIKKEADGSISKMVSFPKDGFWVSFVRTPGKDAMVVVTIQKLAPQ